MPSKSPARGLPDDNGGDGTKRMIALTLAILHHASSNMADKAVPAGWETVLSTADGFLKWINGGEVPTRGRR